MDGHLTLYSSANAFNLDWSKILWFGKALTEIFTLPTKISNFH